VVLRGAGAEPVVLGVTKPRLKAIEAGNLAARIEALDAVRKQRDGDGKA
jgi:hypothetical protein